MGRGREGGIFFGYEPMTRTSGEGAGGGRGARSDIVYIKSENFVASLLRTSYDRGEEVEYDEDGDDGSSALEEGEAEDGDDGSADDVFSAFSELEEEEAELEEEAPDLKTVAPGPGAGETDKGGETGGDPPAPDVGPRGAGLSDVDKGGDQGGSADPDPHVPEGPDVQGPDVPSAFSELEEEEAVAQQERERVAQKTLGLDGAAQEKMEEAVAQKTLGLDGAAQQKMEEEAVAQKTLGLDGAAQEKREEEAVAQKTLGLDGAAQEKREEAVAQKALGLHGAAQEKMEMAPDLKTVAPGPGTEKSAVGPGTGETDKGGETGLGEEDKGGEKDGPADPDPLPDPDGSGSGSAGGEETPPDAGPHQAFSALELQEAARRKDKKTRMSEEEAVTVEEAAQEKMEEAEHEAEAEAELMGITSRVDDDPPKVAADPGTGEKDKKGEQPKKITTETAKTTPTPAAPVVNEADQPMESPGVEEKMKSSNDDDDDGVASTEDNSISTETSDEAKEKDAASDEDKSNKAADGDTDMWTG